MPAKPGLLRVTAAASHRDITERKRTEHELQRFRGDGQLGRRHRSLWSPESQHALHRCQPDAEARRKNGSGSYSRQGSSGMTPMELLGQSQEKLERDYDALIADGSSTTDRVEATYPPEGRSCAGTDRSAPARVERANGWIIVGTTRDITDRKQAERELRESERRFSDLLQSDAAEYATVTGDREAGLPTATSTCCA